MANSSLEAERFEEASEHLKIVLAVRQSLLDAEVTVRALEDRILVLAVRVSVQDEKLDAALAYHLSLIHI